RPRPQYCRDKGGQRYCEKYAPQAPDAAEDQHRGDDGHRVQVDHFGEQQRYQHVAVEELDDAVGAQHVPEMRRHAELEVGHYRHRHGGHRRTDIRHDHRQADDQRQQHGVGQAEQREHHVAHAPHDQDLDELAAYVAADAGFHIGPHAVDQAALARQEGQEPRDDVFLVHEHEEHQQRYQHQIDEEGDEMHR